MCGDVEKDSLWGNVAPVMLLASLRLAPDTWHTRAHSIVIGSIACSLKEFPF